MAIARDNFLTVCPDITGTSGSFSFTCTGSNLYLFVGIMEVDGVTDRLTNVTYSGVSMTKIASIVDGINNPISMWGLANPSTGSNLVAYTANSILFEGRFFPVSYSGASGGLDNSTTNSGTSASPYTTTLTTIADNCWTYLIVRGAVAVTAGTGSTFLSSDSGSDGRFTNSYDSSGPLTPAGSQSMSVTHAAVNFCESIMVSVSPLGVTVVTHFLSLTGAGT